MKLGSIIGAGLGSIAGPAGTAIGGALGGAIDGAGSSPSSDGINSAVQGSNTPPPATPPKTSAFGAQAKELMNETLTEMAGGAKDAVSGGLQSIITDKLTGGAGKQGRNARAYLDQAFPELNAWEKAGAGASGIGAQTGEDNAMKMKRMELKNAKEIAQIQANTAIKTTDMTNKTTESVNNANLEPVLQKLGPELDKLSSEISQIKANTRLTDAQKDVAINAVVTEKAKAHNLDANTVKAAAETNAVNTSRSVAGGIAHDIDYWGNELTDRAKKLGSDVWDGVRSYGSNLKNQAQHWKNKKKLTITVKPKT